jgi:hypothetical protein
MKGKDERNRYTHCSEIVFRFRFGTLLFEADVSYVYVREGREGARARARARERERDMMMSQLRQGAKGNDSSANLPVN